MDCVLWQQNLQRLRQRSEEEDDDNLNDDRFFKIVKIISMYNLGSRMLSIEHGCSRVGRLPNINRNRREGHQRILQDYFAENPVYNEKLFRRRFRMRKSLYNKIIQDVAAADDYFQQKKNALGVPGLSTIQKVTAACRMLCYGVAADSVDEYLRIGESTATECIKIFCSVIFKVYETEYCRFPTQADVSRWLALNEKRGFPGMFGSLDCTHWIWKNCPVAWQGQHQDKSGKRSIIMEAIATQDLWIWHAYIGMPGSNNDINVVDRSPLVGDFFKGELSKSSFVVNGKKYEGSYLLCDGIYPSWPIFVKTIAQPQGEKNKHYAKMQEAVRKDVERCFGVLQARFAILANPCRLWSQEMMVNIWNACVILHNMIIEDESEDSELNHNYLLETFDQFHQESQGPSMSFNDLCSSMIEIQNHGKYFELRNDIVNHLWQVKGNQ